jgi:hypothetical protein
MVYGTCADDDALKQFAQVTWAESGRLYVDVEGVSHWENRSGNQTRLLSPVMEIRRSTSVYEMVRKRVQDFFVNRVTIDFKDRVAAGVAESVYSQVNPLQLEASTPYWVGPPISAFWYSAPMSTIQVAALVTGETDIPVEELVIGTIVANTAADGSGTAVTVTNSLPPFPFTSPGSNVYYQMTVTGSTAAIRMWNSRGVPVYITALTLTGKPNRNAALYRVSVDDELSQQQYGEVVEQVIESNWLPTLPVAQERATTHLYSLAGTVASIDIPSLDGIPWLHAQDSVRFVDDRETPSQTFYLRVFSHQWKFDTGGYTSNLRTVPSLPTTQFIVYDELPPLVVVVARVSRTPPFLWDTNLEWSQGAWE